MKRRRAAVAVNNNGDVALTRDHVGPSPLTLRKTVLGSTSIEHKQEWVHTCVAEGPALEGCG